VDFIARRLIFKEMDSNEDDFVVLTR